MHWQLYKKYSFQVPLSVGVKQQADKVTATVSSTQLKPELNAVLFMQKAAFSQLISNIKSA